MKRIEILRMKSPFRDDFVIEGFHFGGEAKTVAVVGSMRGDEVQQLFVASQVVKNLCQLDAEGKINPDMGILVIPTVNAFSLNVQKRFWAMDNTDVNRMFPGYDRGETTQRIAAALFEAVKNYEWGIQLASYYMNGNFTPHVRIMKTGYEDITAAENFGLPFVCRYEPAPFDTVVLNYNWQIFGTKAYSLYSGSTDVLSHDMAKQSWQAILRFLGSLGAISVSLHPGSRSLVFNADELVTVSSLNSGMLYSRVSVGQYVRSGDTLASILHPFTGETLQLITSPSDGVVFFAHTKPLVHQHSRIFQILKL